ncbi:MAG: hypothetical protein AAGF33_14620 [Pseudomonadota bacterium]
MEGQLLVNVRGVGLIARNTIQSFGEYNFKFVFSGIAKQSLDSGSIHRCTGDGVIGVTIYDRPPLGVGFFLTLTDLILN